MKKMSIIGMCTAFIVAMTASVSLALELKLTPGQKLALVDGSYLTMQGQQIAHTTSTGKVKTFPLGAKLQCDDAGHVTIWGTGGTAIWGTGGTAITKSDLCMKIVKQGQKFEDPTFRKGFEDPTFQPKMPVDAGKAADPQPDLQKR